MNGMLRRLACSARATYEADKPRYRAKIVRVIEDLVLLYLMGAAVWSLAHVADQALRALGVG